MTDLIPGNDFILGVNYWLRRKAMYWWSNFDAGEVREEFSVIREIGLKIVRLFLLWDDFQPEPDSVSREALDHPAAVADIAGENNLGLDVTFFTGHMSGPNWSPHERVFGLVRPDGSLKPHAKVIQDFAATNPQVRPIPEYAKFNLDPEEFYKNPVPFLLEFYAKYLEGVPSSEPPVQLFGQT